MSKRQYYVGKSIDYPGHWQVFSSEYGQYITEEMYPCYSVVIGPHKHKHAAHFMRNAVMIGNPHCRTTADAERLSAYFRKAENNK